MRTLFFGLLTLISFPLSAQYCTTYDRFTEVQYFDATEVDTISNVVYGYALDYLGVMDTLLIDVYMPNQGVDPLSERPTALIIHGGAFQTGNKLDRSTECTILARSGYVAISLGYRIGWDQADPFNQVVATYRAQQDAQAALRYIVENAATYGIDTNWLFIGGSSAGSLTSANVLYVDQSEWNSALPTIPAQLGDLDTSGNALTNTYTLNGYFNMWGSVPGFAMQADEMVPMLSFHGELDTTVPIDTSSADQYGSRAMHIELVNEGVCSELYTEPNGGHGIYTAVYRGQKAACFFRSIFCDNCSTLSSINMEPADCSSTVGLTENSLEVYRLYPNPSNGDIKIDGLTGGENLQLITMTGQTLYTGAEIDELNRSFRKAGIYFVLVDNGIRQERMRVVRY